MSQKDPQQPPRDPEQDRLVDLTRSLARRSWVLLRRGRGRNASPLFLQCAHEATQLLDAAADFLRASELSAAGSHTQIETAPAETPEPPAIDPNAEIAPSGGPAGAGEQFELRGRCVSISITELLNFLGTLQKSGSLWIGTRDESFKLQLEEGFVVHAESDGAPPELKLGALLVRGGVLSQQQLDRFLASTAGRKGHMGTNLEKAGLVTREQLARALEYQIGKLFQRLANLSDATFSFEEEHVAPSSENRVRLGVLSLQLKTAHAIDEESRLSFDAALGDKVDQDSLERTPARPGDTS